MDQWTIHGTVHFVTDCQYCTKSSGSCINFNGFTLVLTSYSVLMCNWEGVSNENLVVMSAH